MRRHIIVALLWVVCAYSPLCAQATYMGVTLERGKDSEKNCIYVINDNADSVRILIQYKIGNRKTKWINYPVTELIPPSIMGPQKIGCVDSTIIGLNLVDVKIVRNNFLLVDEKSDEDEQQDKGFSDKIKSLWSKIKSWF
jgi:hypothetical protein